MARSWLKCWCHVNEKYSSNLRKEQRGPLDLSDNNNDDKLLLNILFEAGC